MKKPAKTPAKTPAKPFHPQSVAAQRAAHHAQLHNARKALRQLQHFRPVPVKVQRRQNAQAVAKQAAAAKKARHAKHAGKARGWSPDSDVALCSARAVAESLRLALGVTVDDGDVLALHRAAGGDRDAGASISDVLGAVQRRGLRGFQPQYELSEVLSGVPLILGVDWPQPHAVVLDDGAWWSWGEPYEPWTGEVTEAWAVTWQP